MNEPTALRMRRSVPRPIRMTQRIVAVMMVAGACLLCLHLTPVSVARPSASAMDEAEVPDRRGRASWYSAETVAEVGRSRVIAFEWTGSDSASTTDDPSTIKLDWTNSDGEILEVIAPPVVLTGQPRGYVRVRGRAPGRSVLQIGNARIRVIVQPNRVPGSAAQYRPRIIGPADGAIVWGTISIGVEILELPGQSPRKVEIQLSNGDTLQPTFDAAGDSLPYHQFVFEINTDELPSGWLTLTPIVQDRNVDDRDRNHKNVQQGDPVHLKILPMDAIDVWKGEAEATYDLERPERFPARRKSIGRDGKASGGAYFSNASSRPAACFPLEVTDAQGAGLYQIMLVVGGTRAQGVLPTVGIVVDNEDQSRTNGRVLLPNWHRVAMGLPITLSPGKHVITPYFANDFFAPGLTDRNLQIDRIEIARVADVTPDGANNDAPAMMSMMMAAKEMKGEQADAAPQSMATIDDAFGQQSPPLRIGFVRPLDGLTLPGLFEVEGRLAWAGMENSARRAPLVTLRVNDIPVMTQQSGAPRFWVGPSHFKAGANTIQLIATSDIGAIATTPKQTMYWMEEAAQDADRAPARQHHRFSIHDDRWGKIIRTRLANSRNPKERMAAVFSSPGQEMLTIPENLEGPFDVYAEALGEHFKGAPQLDIGLKTPAAKEIQWIAQANIPTYWDTRRIGLIDLPAGPKQLVIAFKNDAFVEGEGDRNLLVQAILLVDKSGQDDLSAPMVALQYPPNGQVMYAADAIVATASDNMSLNSAELILDGMASGLTQSLNLKPGNIVMQLPLRTLEPGEHTLAIRVSDIQGNTTTSELRTVNILGDPPVRPTAYARAVHLLDRFAYGPDKRELAAVLIMGEDDWLQDRLSQPVHQAGDLAARGVGFPFFVQKNNYEIPSRVVSHLSVTPNPVRSRFVMWVQNHFSTWIRKTEADRKWDEFVQFDQLGVAPFDHLLFASAQSPAMLLYLDQEVSYAGRLNENLAREIMELHTLGVDGGYSQQDVTNMAHLLTGWTVSLEGDGRGGGRNAREYTFRFDPRLNDRQPMQILGFNFETSNDPVMSPPAMTRYDRTRHAIETLASHPSTAHYIATKLAHHYVGLPADDALVHDLENVFHTSGGDMQAMLLAIAHHPAFWRAMEKPKIAQPMDYAIRMARATNQYHPWRIMSFLTSSGTGLFDHPTPDGYPEDDAAYTDSNAMVQRWRLAQDSNWALAGMISKGWRYNDAMSDDRWANLVVDSVAIGLTGNVLSAASHEAALGLLQKSTGNRDNRVRTISAFIAQLPEANVR